MFKKRKATGLRVAKIECWCGIKNQIALLYKSPDIEHKVQEVVEKERKQLEEVKQQTGWKPNQRDNNYWRF